MGAGTELQEGWAGQAEKDAAELEQHGIARMPWNLVVADNEDVAQVIGHIQHRREFAARERAQAEYTASKAELDADRIWERYEGQLRDFTERAIGDKGARHIKVRTGHGGRKPTRVGFRRVPGGLRVVDDERAMRWAADEFTASKIEDFIKVTQTQTPVADAYKQHFADTGEIPEGCIVFEDEDKFYFKWGLAGEGDCAGA